MNTDHSKFDELFEKWFHEKGTSAESEEFLLMAQDPKKRDRLMRLMEEAGKTVESHPFYTTSQKAAIANTILEKYPADEAGQEKASELVHRSRLLRTAWFRYAAVVLIVMGTTYYFYTVRNERANNAAKQNESAFIQPIKPGKEGAVLTLADGKTIVLDSVVDGVVANQAGSEAVLNNGRLLYNAAGSREVTYHTLTTPKGRKFRLVLPDGSKVWLNAASSITYPTAFTGTDRRVSVTGEVFFEVASLAKRPFYVKAGDLLDVQVLGTSFNVNTYEDEPVATTAVLEGSVSVTCPAAVGVSADKGRVALLNPGQQAVWGGNTLRVKNVDVNEAAAWVKGIFNWKGVELKTALRQISRWYNVDIKYADNTNETLAGSAYQSDSLEDILEVLGYASNVTFKVSGNTIYVTKK